ncbi:putative transcription factor cys6 [Erysiphe neolycopersici]|uniref:Putative transcription factor cys6 n=1 Tax=Erysiphe neolycopersici TaxID=212602 RepID=A0A420I0L0_9PEZI|nr:putative transcription factor cys6 [Erysiphe neolycopersici]
MSSEELLLSNPHVPRCMITTQDVEPKGHFKIVLRACERCRRRKIKCDAATTNTWPCSACKRLKICCVPPTLRYDQESLVTTVNQESDLQRVICSGEDCIESCQTQLACLRQFPEENMLIPSEYSESHDQFSSEYYLEPSLNYNQSIHSNENLQYYLQQQINYDPVSFPHSIPLQTSAGSYKKNNLETGDLADLLGELMIGENGTGNYKFFSNKKMKKLTYVAPYLSKKVQSRISLEEPAFGDVEEYSEILPPSIFGPDLKVRIPPELMPDDETCQQYFRIYFENIHPYVPVLNKYLFYRHWLTDRESLSPLILEAIFALACQLAGRPSESNQWLALFTKHANSFLDRPRLSTLQATLICLKGREATPQRGYYYRSWMTVVQCIEMARDLGLDEHFANHKAGKSCGSDHYLCALKSRIWQTVFVCEMMIGTPQGRFVWCIGAKSALTQIGRTVLSVNIDSVDIRIPRVILEDDDTEPYISRDFAHIAIVCRNIRILNNVCSRIKNSGPKWWFNPEFTRLGPLFESLIKNLPDELQVTYPSDGSPPWLRSHFVGNLHSYYHLSILMLHRHPLKHMEPKRIDGSWKYHMSICFNSAKLLCRLQEAIFQSYGSDGILCMQRGLNFSIYCNLTCTALYLLALMSSDDELKADAHEYFPRHMRILERCSGFWQMSDIQQQIASLRMAFTANSNKPLNVEMPFHDTSTSLNSCELSQQDLEFLPANNLITSHQELNVTTSNSENQPLIWPSQTGALDSQNDFSYMKQTLLENQVSSDSHSIDEISLPDCNSNIQYDLKSPKINYLRVSDILERNKICIPKIIIHGAYDSNIVLLKTFASIKISKFVKITIIRV